MSTPGFAVAGPVRRVLPGRLRFLLTVHWNFIPPLPVPAAAPTDPKLDPPIGDDELGRIGYYRVQNIIGRGGMGVVYQAEDTRLRRTVALKVTTGKLAASEKSRRAFLEEARSMAAVDHDNVATIYEVGSHASTPYLAMELLRGETLGDRIRRQKQERAGAIRNDEDAPKLKSTAYFPGLFPPDFIADVARQTCAGLVAAHSRGIIHRDIKPANLWLQPIDGSPDRPRVKILDFGLAIAGSGEAIGGETVVGTPGYLSPEQARNDPVDARTDLYSLAVVMTEMAVGRVPILQNNVPAQMVAILCQPIPPITEIDPSFPGPLSDLISRLLSKEPADRPASAAEVIGLIDDAVEASRHLADAGLQIQVAQPVEAGSGSSVSARRGGKKSGAPALSKRKPLMMIGATCAALTLVGLGWWWSQRRESAPATPTTINAAATPDANRVTAASLSPLRLAPDVTGDLDAAEGEPARFIVSLLNEAADRAADPRVIHSGERRVAQIKTYLRPVGGDGQPASLRRPAPAFPRIFSAGQLPAPGRLENVELQFLAKGLARGLYEVEFELQSPAGAAVDIAKTRLSIAENLLRSELLEFEVIAANQGEGADTTIFAPGSQPAATNRVIQTIGGPQPAHGYLRFDLSTIDDRQSIDRAVVLLTVQKGGFNSEGDVSVYGWSGPPSQTWSDWGAKALRWAGAPSGVSGNPQAFAGLDYLGSMRVDNRSNALAGKSRELRFASESLDRFLRNGSGPTATIVLVARFGGENPLVLVSTEQSTQDCAALAVRRTKKSTGGSQKR